MEERQGNEARFFAQLDSVFERLIQEARVDDPVVEREYKRAISDAKEAYNCAQIWKPAECSDKYKDDLGRLLASTAMQKGMKRAELTQIIFKAGEKRVGTEAITNHMTPSRVDELYEVAHQQAFPPGYPYKSLKPQEFRFLVLLPATDPSSPLQCRNIRLYRMSGVRKKLKILITSNWKPMSLKPRRICMQNYDNYGIRLRTSTSGLMLFA
jgi:hypothetical protein